MDKGLVCPAITIVIYAITSGVIRSRLTRRTGIDHRAISANTLTVSTTGTHTARGGCHGKTLVRAAITIIVYTVAGGVISSPLPRYTTVLDCTRNAAGPPR